MFYISIQLKRNTQIITVHRVLLNESKFHTHNSAENNQEITYRHRGTSETGSIMDRLTSLFEARHFFCENSTPTSEVLRHVARISETAVV